MTEAEVPSNHLDLESRKYMPSSWALTPRIQASFFEPYASTIEGKDVDFDAVRRGHALTLILDDDMNELAGLKIAAEAASIIPDYPGITEDTILQAFTNLNERFQYEMESGLPSNLHLEVTHVKDALQ